MVYIQIKSDYFLRIEVLVAVVNVWVLIMHYLVY